MNIDCCHTWRSVGAFGCLLLVGSIALCGGDGRSVRTQELLQAAIDLPEFDEYFHVDVRPERVPLVLLQNEYVSESLSLRRFGKPVVILTSERIDKEGIDSFMRVKSLRVDGRQATIVLEYPPEGIELTATFEQQDNHWKVVEKVLVEH